MSDVNGSSPSSWADINVPVAVTHVRPVMRRRVLCGAAFIWFVPDLPWLRCRGGSLRSFVGFALLLRN
jgi:hypothetical protein